MGRVYGRNVGGTRLVYLEPLNGKCSPKNIQTGIQYAVTEWEGKQHEVVVEFKRMQLYEGPADSEIELKIITNHA